MENEKKYNYFYKITNNINNHFYYGIHSTNNLNDNYMGSGSYLHAAYKKYGIENFTKEILKYFDTRKELAEYERKIVNEDLIKDLNCYNISLGGETFNTINSVVVKDKYGNIFRCKKDDPKYLNGELISVAHNLIPIIDINNNRYCVTKEEYYNNKNKYTLILPTKIKVKHKNVNENYFNIDCIEYSNNKNIYETYYSTTVLVKNEVGKNIRISKNDPKYLTGEYKGITYGYKHTNQTKEKISNKLKGVQCGEKNSQYNKKWINNGKINKFVKDDELEYYLSNNWNVGRINVKTENFYGHANTLNKKWINKNNVNKYINKNELNMYLQDGWKLGRYKK